MGWAPPRACNRRQLVAQEGRNQTDDQQGCDCETADKTQSPLWVYRAEQDRSGNHGSNSKRNAADEGRAFKAGNDEQGDRHYQRQVLPQGVAGDEEHGGHDAGRRH